MVRKRRGQVAVETALVMPLTVFLMLGTLQMGLMHQARLLTKYAAYKAVRAGALHNAKQSTMRNAALAVLVPITALPGTLTGAGGALAKLRPTTDATGYIARAALVRARNLIPTPSLVTVRICEPTGINNNLNFDDPAVARPGTDWRNFNRTKLSIQLTYNYQLIIPFVNGILWHVTRGIERAETMRLLRMRAPLIPLPKKTPDILFTMAAAGQYYLPIRAGWTMRMQSDFLPQRGGDFAIPGRNDCLINWSSTPPGR